MPFNLRFLCMHGQYLYVNNVYINTDSVAFPRSICSSCVCAGVRVCSWPSPSIHHSCFGAMPLLGAFGQKPAPLGSSGGQRPALPASSRRDAPQPASKAKDMPRPLGRTRKRGGAKAVVTKPKQATRTTSRSVDARGRPGSARRSSRDAGVLAEAKSSSSTTIPSRRVDLPSTLKTWLGTWGPKLRSVVEEVRAGWPRSSGVSVNFRSLNGKGLRLGADCSGAEAPVWALRCLGVAFQHVFSCDHEPAVQEFIRATSPPSHSFFSDMLGRTVADIPEIDIYVCGFPCTPYSSLRAHNTKLFREKAAKPYFEILRILREKEPPLAILENVVGLGRVVDKVLRDLRRLRRYYVLWMQINSEDLGEPVARPRYYFLLIRYDAGIFKNMADIADFCAKCLGAASAPVKDHVSNRMLPNDHPEVLAFRRKQDQTPRRPPAGVKWQEAHAKLRQQVPVFRGGLQSRMPLASARQRDVWTLLLQRAGAKDIIADVSQSLDRQHPRRDGVSPTITPRGVLCVGSLDRIVIPIEKLLLHGFPIHRVSIPSSVSNEALGKMGGNTMHLQRVGLALLMGISLLRDPLPINRAGAERSNRSVAAQFVVPSLPAKRGMSHAAPVSKQAWLS